MLAIQLFFLRKLHTVVDIFPARISQYDSSVVGFARLWGIELFHIYLAGFKERSGNFCGKGYFSFLEKAVILPHDKGTFFVAAIIVFLPLMDRRTATGAFADRGLFLPEQILFPVQCCGVCLHKLPRHSFNAGQKFAGVCGSLCYLRQIVFPFCGKLRGSEYIRQNTDKAVPFLVGISCFPLRSAKPPFTSFSMTAARVAGVPSPRRSASGSVSPFPARSIADRSDLLRCGASAALWYAPLLLRRG